MGNIGFSVHIYFELLDTKPFRISKKRGEIFSEIPNLDVLSDDLILLECSDVKRTLTTPILEKLRKGVKGSTPHVQKFKFIDVKAENVSKTQKSNPTKTYKSRTPKAGDTTPKSLIRRPNEAINEPMEVTEISKSTITVKRELPKCTPKKVRFNDYSVKSVLGENDINHSHYKIEIPGEKVVQGPR